MEIRAVLAGALAVALAGCASPGGTPVSLRAPGEKWEHAVQGAGLDRDAADAVVVPVSTIAN